MTSNFHQKITVQKILLVAQKRLEIISIIQVKLYEKKMSLC